MKLIRRKDKKDIKVSILELILIGFGFYIVISNINAARVYDLTMFFAYIVFLLVLAFMFVYKGIKFYIDFFQEK